MTYAGDKLGQALFLLRLCRNPNNYACRKKGFQEQRIGGQVKSKNRIAASTGLNRKIEYTKRESERSNEDGKSSDIDNVSGDKTGVKMNRERMQ